MDRTLAQYVIRYYGHLMTDEEKFAYNHLCVQDKMSHASSKGMHAHLHSLLTTNPDVLALTECGLEEFIQRTAERLMRLNGSKVHLNYCPACGKLAKTPKARQCRFCLHDWRSA
jgi:hypothetical protein